MRIIVFLLFMTFGASATFAEDKPFWQLGCEHVFQRRLDELISSKKIAQGIIDPKDFTKERCERVRATMDWSKAKNTKFDGCAEAVSFLLDGGKVTDHQQRKAMLIEYCM